MPLPATKRTIGRDAFYDLIYNTLEDNAGPVDMYALAEQINSTYQTTRRAVLDMVEDGRVEVQRIGPNGRYEYGPSKKSGKNIYVVRHGKRLGLQDWLSNTLGSFRTQIDNPMTPVMASMLRPVTYLIAQKAKGLQWWSTGTKSEVTDYYRILSASINAMQEWIDVLKQLRDTPALWDETEVAAYLANPKIFPDRFIEQDDEIRLMANGEYKAHHESAVIIESDTSSEELEPISFLDAIKDADNG